MPRVLVHDVFTPSDADVDQHHTDQIYTQFGLCFTRVGSWTQDNPLEMKHTDIILDGQTDNKQRWFS